MYTFELIANNREGVMAPTEIVSYFEKKLYPQIIKKLRKAGYEPEKYRIDLSHEMWKLNSDEIRTIRPCHVFEQKEIRFWGSIYRKHYPNGDPSCNEFFWVIAGGISAYWKFNDKYSAEEVNQLIVDGNMTQLLISPICKFEVLDLNIVPLLHKLESSSKPSQGPKDFEFPCEIIGEDYPDTIFNVHFSHPVTQKQLKKLNAVLDAYMRRQQDGCDDEDETTLHYIGKAECSDEDEYVAQIHIDFGGCEPEMIWDVLAELSERVEDIVKVIVN